MKLTFGTLVTETLLCALKNAASVLGASLLWILTLWVPYINVGTTIALFYGMPLELSRGGIMSPVAIFDAKYRKFMGEFFSIVGLMMLSLIPAFLFMIVPGIIIAIGWMFAILLVVDKEMNPAQALTESTKYTYGYKWTLFLGSVIINVAFYVAAMLIMGLVTMIDVSFITVIISIALLAVGVTLGVAFSGVAYRYLVLDRR